MSGTGGKEAAAIQLDVLLQDGSKAASYRLAPPWEDSTGGGAAVASTETTASVAAPSVPPQAAPLVARLVLTIVSAGNTSTILLVPRGEAGEAGEAHWTSSISLEIHPIDGCAALRIFSLLGSQKKWASTVLYKMCCASLEGYFSSVSIENLFGSEVREFHARRCQELPFPPFKLNYTLDFNCLKLLGRGIEGKVSRCSSNFSDYVCAIKEVAPSDFEIRPTNSEPSEVSVLVELNHPNVMRLYHAWNERRRNSFGYSADVTFTSMMLCDRTLATYLKGISEIQSDIAGLIFKQLMMGVAHLHERLIVHHDLKPANILLNNDLTVKISDFGTERIA